MLPVSREMGYVGLVIYNTLSLLASALRRTSCKSLRNWAILETLAAFREFSSTSPSWQCLALEIRHYEVATHNLSDQAMGPCEVQLARNAICSRRGLFVLLGTSRT